MATNKFKKIDQPKEEVAETHKHNLAVIMPFIKFGVSAMKMIAGTLIYIVKHIPKPGHEAEHKTKPGGRIIKVK